MPHDRSLWKICLDALGSTKEEPSASDEEKVDRGFAKVQSHKTSGTASALHRNRPPTGALPKGDPAPVIPSSPRVPLSSMHMDVDAAFQERHGRTPKAGVGIHLREWGLGVALPIRATLSSEAEAVGIWVTLHLADRLQVQPLIACDNQSVAESISQRKLTLGRWRSEAPTRTPLFASRIIHEARNLRTKLGAQVEWTEREDNHVPHLLAAIAVRNSATLVFLPSDEVKAEELLLKHEFRSESLGKIEGPLPVELSREGLAWQDWNTQRYLDALAQRIRALSKPR